MKIALNKPGKLELSGSTRDQEYQPDDVVEAVLKVCTPGYIPPQVTLRARIDTTMFTGEMPFRALEEIDSDPEVISVSISKPLRFN